MREQINSFSRFSAIANIKKNVFRKGILVHNDHQLKEKLFANVKYFTSKIAKKVQKIFSEPI